MGCPCRPMQNLWFILPSRTVPSQQHPGMRAIRYALIQFNLPPDSVVLVSSNNFTVVLMSTSRDEPDQSRHITAVPSSPETTMVSQSKLSSRTRNVITDSQSRQNQIPSIRLVSPPIYYSENFEDLCLQSWMTRPGQKTLCQLTGQVYKHMLVENCLQVLIPPAWQTQSWSIFCWKCQ